MKTIGILISRNIKLYFKDKGTFFTSLITPMILLVLFATFLGKTYTSVFESNIPEGVIVSSKIIKSCVGGQLMSSIIAVSCVTVAFCSNMIMVQDKALNSINDFTIAPVKRSSLAISYYLATVFNTLIVCYAAMICGLLYIAATGWYMSFFDVICLIFDIFILVLFGTALSSIINFFLKTQGQISAVGTIISAGYGFFCGAYYPISQFGTGLQRVLGFLPSTYGTVLVRNHTMKGTFKEMLNAGFPAEVVEGIKDSIDYNVYFFNNQVGVGNMYLIMISSVVVLVGIYIFLNVKFQKHYLK